MSEPPTPNDDRSARPQWAADVRRRLSSVHLSPAREAEIVEELTQHLDDRWREFVASGATPEEATRLTRAEFREDDVLARGLSPLRQSHASASITPGAPARQVFGDLWQDLRYAVRTMAARPGFSATAVLSLALGIGADTAIFGLWHGVLHASLPAVRDPDTLVMLSNPDERGSWTGRLQGERSWLTYGEFEQLRDHADAFSALMASESSLNTWGVRVESGWERASGRLVSGEFFQVLGVGAAIGRLFTAADDQTDIPSAVISHHYWQHRFGGRADVLGSALTIRKTAFTIIGVTPRGFIGETTGQQPDFWLPLRTQPLVLPGRDRLHDTPPDKTMWLNVFGRLRPGIALAQADAQANAVFHAGLESFYGAAAAGERRREFLDQRLRIRPGGRGASATRHQFSQSLLALLAAVAVLLLIACANLATLLLARGAARQAEMALRLSLGASRGRLVRQLVTESVTLVAIGAAAALAVAYVFHATLVRLLARADEDFAMSFGVNPPILACLVVTTLTAVLLLAVLPAWYVTATEAGASLKQQSRGFLGSLREMRSGRLLVTLQLGLSLPLLVGAGLLARTVYNLQRADLGFPSERLLLVRVDMREAGHDEPRRDRELRTLVDEIEGIPGIQAASYSQLGVFSGGESSATIEVEGYAPTRDEDRESALDAVGPGYFSALGVPMRLGRELLEDDRDGATNVCVINEAFARRFFRQRNPLGMHIRMVNDENRSTYRVIGVANDARTQTLRDDVAPRFFVPLSRRASLASSPTLVIRTVLEKEAMMATVRKTIQRVDAALPILSATSIEDQMAPLTAQDRTTAQLTAVFAAVALALAVIGLYGLLSYGVARRRGEIAIRIALGARSGRIVSMILGETLQLVAAGLAMGGGLAYVGSRLIDSRLYGVAPKDPFMLSAATGLLLVVALMAAYLPARRAARVDPMTALRQG